MAYPTVFQSYNSRRKALQSMAIDIATDGSVRGVDEFSAPTFEFTVVHEHVVSTDVSAIEACYTSSTGAGTTTSFVWAADGKTYNVVFKMFPDSVRQPGEEYFEVTSYLVGREST